MCIQFDDILISPQNNPLITSAMMQTMYLNLYCNDVDETAVTTTTNLGYWFQLVPFVNMHRVNNATPSPFVRQKFGVNGISIAWDKSQIVVPVALGNNAIASILLNVEFKGLPTS